MVADREKVVPFPSQQRKNIRLSTCKLQDLPCIPLTTVLECLADEEYGDGRLFALIFRGLCVYDFLEKVWYWWEGHYWVRDDGQRVYHLVSGFLSSVYIKASAEVNLQIKGGTSNKKLTDDDDGEESKEDTQQKKLKSQKTLLLRRADVLKKISRVRNILEYAMSDRVLQVPHKRTGKEVEIAWDRNPWLLATHQGILDLHTGKIVDGNPSDFIRTVVPTRWEGLDKKPVRFEQFLQEIFSDRTPKERDELIHFLHKVFGYGITGLFQIHIFLALIGDEGRNGKDTLIQRICTVMGQSLAGPVSKELFIASKFGSSPGAASPHKMSLQGKRLAWCSETDKGESFGIAQIKDLTGTKQVRARALRENEQTFDATHLLLLMTNHAPHADASDKAFWERICPIMFRVRFVDNPEPGNPLEHKPDIRLGDMLDDEASAILAWLVRGCLLWQQEGLSIPQEILKERANYRADEDTIGRFIQECCVLRPICTERKGILYSTYQTWAEDNGMKPMNGITFGRDMERRFKKTNPQNKITYHGVGLRSDTQYEQYVQEDNEKASKDSERNEQQAPEHTPLAPDDTALLVEQACTVLTALPTTFEAMEIEGQIWTPQRMIADLKLNIQDSDAGREWARSTVKSLLPGWKQCLTAIPLREGWNVTDAMKQDAKDKYGVNGYSQKSDKKDAS